MALKRDVFCTELKNNLTWIEVLAEEGMINGEEEKITS